MNLPKKKTSINPLVELIRQVCHIEKKKRQPLFVLFSRVILLFYIAIRVLYNKNGV